MDLLNESAKDLRLRAESLCKAIFVLSGGALSISLGIFTNSSIQLSECLNTFLAISWWSLFICIVSLVLSLFSMVIRDYFFVERLRSVELFDKDKDISGKPGFADFLIWLFGVLGLLSFIVGYFTLAYVATNAIST